MIKMKKLLIIFINLFITLNDSTLNFLKTINNSLKRIRNKNMETSLLLPILEISYHDKGRFLSFTLSNKYLGDHYQALKSIFYTLTNNEKFNDFSNKKIIITSALINGTEYGYHYNTLIDKNTTFQDFYDNVKDSKMIQNYEDEYPIDVIPYFIVKV
jgi:hypothetical protein